MDRRLRAALVDAGLVALALLDAWLSNAYAVRSTLTLSLVAALALAVRRRHPLAVFALTVPALFSGYVLIAPLAALYTVAAVARSRLPIAACAVVAGLGYFLPWPLDRVDVGDLFGDPLGLIYAAVFAGAPVALGLLVRTRQELSNRFDELTAGREREQQLVAQTVLTEERTRLAREMHDVVSHQVSLIAVQAGALSTTTADDDVRAAADTIRRLSVQTLTELRQMVGVLRSSGEPAQELAPQPGIGDIPRLVRDSGQDAALRVDGVADRSWPDAVQRAAYRTVQEALTNVGKHAPGAPVTVTLSPAGPALRVTVRNDPPPQAAPSPAMPGGGGHGLVGLRERAEQLGGVFRASSIADGGFVVEAVLPGEAQPAPVSTSRRLPEASLERPGN
ncbi:Signal transduction histidine kinase [Geodermatophilus siccatus]|uniref:histidine kinase n=1 Tax=Geodermatophilus siccatus TaxID=1137991 RepID=A0A1G9QLZ1_9ACTN|nr:histidine kinase [Geodermatophilus siccatus]SDM11890.1 Signal transduction histidine kinase [Geodermatophilus siccatus]